MCWQGEVTLGASRSLESSRLANMRLANASTGASLAAGSVSSSPASVATLSWMSMDMNICFGINSMARPPRPSDSSALLRSSNSESDNPEIS